MMRRRHIVALAVAPLAGTAAAQAPRQERVRFAPGTNGATLRRRITGDETIDYLVGARAGQTMSVVMRSSNRSAYFNVNPPGSDEAIFIGSTSGDRFEGRLPADGDTTIRVYLMRNAARRNEHADITLEIRVSGP